MRRVAVLLAGGLLVAGCGGGKTATDVLGRTADNLPKIRGGTLHVALVVTPRGRRLGGPTGFRVDGPFRLSGGNANPSARIAYTQLASGKSSTVRIVTSKSGGYVEAGGKRTPLSAAQLQQLRVGRSDVTGGLGRVVLDRWIRNPKLSDGGTVGGADTDHVSAGLDVVETVNGLLQLAPGTGVGRISGASAERLRRAVRSASFNLWSGKKDRLLRRATIDVDFSLDVPRTLRRALGPFVGARVHFLFAIDRPQT